MNNSTENDFFEQASQEDLDEQTDITEDGVCIANECIYARWLKPISVCELMFVSKDVLLIYTGKTLLFHNVKTQNDNVVVVGANTLTPFGGDNPIPLNGVTCVSCQGTDLLALADQQPTAKVVICRYPDLKVLATLIDNSCSAAYKCVLFLKLEYLIGLRDYPAFDLIVWAWRIKEKLFSIKTGFIQPNQILNHSATAGRDVYLSQIERDVKCKLQLWTVTMDYKTVFATKVPVNLPEDVYVRTGCWTPSGWFVFCDSSANVYRTRPRAPNPEKCLTLPEQIKDDHRSRVLMGSSKLGFILYTDNKLISFKDAEGVFTQIWTIEVDQNFQSMLIGENSIYGWSDEGALLEVAQKKEQKTLRMFGTNIKYFTFVMPTDETFATIDERNVLQVWHVSTGELKAEIKLNGIATNLCNNPVYYYVAVPFKSGKVEILKTDPNRNDLELVANIILCDEELSSVNFFADAKECVITSFPTGRFYRVNIELGQKCSVLNKFILERQVVDVETFNYKKSSFLAVLYKTQETFDFSANSFVIFDAKFNTIFEMKDTRFCYTSIFRWKSFGVPDLLNLAFTEMLSERVHLIVVNIKTKASMSEIIHLEHKLRNVRAFACGDYCVTFGDDGSYNLYKFNEDARWIKRVTVNCSPWQTGGLIAAKVDSKAINVLTLNYDGTFMCTSFRKTCKHIRYVHKTLKPIIVNNMKAEGIGYEDESKIPKRMNWEMINEMNESETNRALYSKKTKQIIGEYEKIKEELQTLMEMNINGPDDTKINIEEFDLNEDYRKTFREKCQMDLQEYELKIYDDINMYERETKNIVQEKWEKLSVKPKSIYCLMKSYIVDNYSISIEDDNIIEHANEILAKRNLNKYDDNNSSIDTTLSMFSKDILNLLESYTILSEDERLNKNSVTSVIHKNVDFTEVSSHQYHTTVESAEDEQILLKLTIHKLKQSFNRLFDDVFDAKQRLLDSLNDHNNKLKTINVELMLACKIELDEDQLSIEEYAWNQYEHTEQLLTVENDEVPVKRYSGVSNEQNAMSDENSPEYSKQYLATDNFRRRALITMMDGVLEKKWEEELRKDVPIPQCMLKKKPEDYAEEDFKALNEYEKAVNAKNSERMKYKMILEDERTKVFQLIKESIDAFDNSVFQLFQTKLKYNTSIDQENLKIIKLSKLMNDNDLHKQHVKLLEETKSELEKSVLETAEKITNFEAAHNSLLNAIEIMNNKNQLLNKRFQYELRSNGALNQAFIAYNLRPAPVNIKNYSPLVGYHFVDSIIDPNDDKLDMLGTEFVSYLNTLKIFDDYKYVNDNKLNLDQETWQKICNFRRLKIESEFKIGTYQKDASNKINLLQYLTREKKTITENLKRNSIELENLNEQKDDSEIQIILKLGNVEIILNGHLEDFNNTKLIPRNTIEEFNARIKETGKAKTNTINKLKTSKQKNLMLQLDRDILEEQIALYEYRLHFISSMKMPKNVLYYLECKIKGIDIIKQTEEKIKNGLEAVRTINLKAIQGLKKRLRELSIKIENVKKEYEPIDKNILQTNYQLSELKSKMDYNLNKDIDAHRCKRLRGIMERANLMKCIQKLHSEMSELQIQLEILFLRNCFDANITIPNGSSLENNVNS